HAAVALHVTPDLQRRHWPALGHQVGDQRQLADQLLGVLRHPTKIEPRTEATIAAAFASRSLRALGRLAGPLAGQPVGLVLYGDLRLAAIGEERTGADRAVEARPTPS